MELVSWFADRAPELQSALIGAAATLFAAAAGFTAVIIQIGRQNRATLAQNRDLEVLRIRARVYDELSSATRSTVDRSAEFNQVPQRFHFELLTAEVLPLSVPTVRIHALNARWADFSSSHIHLLRTIEMWMVVDPRMQVFMDALNSAHFDYQNAWLAYSKLAMRLMPIEAPAGPDAQQILPWQSPGMETKAQLERLRQDILDTGMAYSMVTNDIEVELQNELVADLFKRGRRKIRKPIDPQYKVVTLHNHAPLSAYYRSEQTAWGREFIASQQRVAEERVEA